MLKIDPRRREKSTSGLQKRAFPNLDSDHRRLILIVLKRHPERHESESQKGETHRPWLNIDREIFLPPSVFNNSAAINHLLLSGATAHVPS